MGFFSKLLIGMSGSSGIELSKQLLFDKVIGFKSISQGAGASSLLYNTAIYLAKNTKFTTCIVDTNFLFPVQDQYLKSKPLKDEKSILYGNPDIATCVRSTEYKNLYCVGLRDATLVELLSGKDNITMANKLFELLTAYFDIILVDLSSEFSNFSTIAAIKCNKIIAVCEDSFKGTLHLEKAISVQRTLGLPLNKIKYFVVNKTVDSSVMTSLIEKSEYTLIDTIPLDVSIATTLASGVAPLLALKSTPAINDFNNATKAIVDSLIKETTITQEYFMAGADSKELLQKDIKGVEVVEKDKEELGIEIEEEDVSSNIEIGDAVDEEISL